MTIMLSRYSGFPPELFEKGLAPKMRDCSFRLYLLLCRESDRMSSRRVSFSDAYAKKLAKISPTSMRLARKQLKELKLATCVRDPGGEYRYDLYDLRTGQLYPGDPKAPLRRKGAGSRTIGPERVTGEHTRSAFIEPEFDSGEQHKYDFGFQSDEACDFPFGANVKDRRVA